MFSVSMMRYYINEPVFCPFIFQKSNDAFIRIAINLLIVQHREIMSPHSCEPVSEDITR